jgi:hypothetical protein
MKGWKTITGTAGWAVCEGLKTVFPDYASVLILAQNAVFVPLGVLGVAHKIDKSGENKNG